MDGVHDLGGLHGFGSVVRTGAERSHDEPWEPRAQALGILAKGIGGTMRRRIEELPAAEYLALPYYARWLAAAERAAVASGMVSGATLAGWVARFEADPGLAVPRVEHPELRARVETRMCTARPMPPAESPRFVVGDAVIVRRMHPVGHHRCPRYVRGVRGIVDAVCGQDDIPADLPGQEGREPVYTVGFTSSDVWGPGCEPPFRIFVDLWQGYLERAT